MLKKFIDYYQTFKAQQQTVQIIEALEKELNISCTEFDPHLKSDLFKMSVIENDPLYREAVQAFREFYAEAASELPANLRGGVIYFSPEVNAVVDAGGNSALGFFKKKISTFKNFFKKKMATLKNLLKTDSLLKKAREAVKEKYGKEIFGNTLQKGLKGTYYFQDPATGVTTAYSEKSMALTVVGVDTRTLIAFATKIADLFEQQEVMLHDFNSGKIRFIKSKTARIRARKLK